MRIIRYGIDTDTGLAVSEVRRYGSLESRAYVVYDFAGFGNDGDFSGPIPGHLEVWHKDDGLASIPQFRGVRWTRKIPTAIKNVHRMRQGFKPICEGCNRPTSAVPVTRIKSLSVEPGEPGQLMLCAACRTEEKFNKYHY